MRFGKNQASQRPTALGSMLQASTYGLTIPLIMGLTKSPLLAIWAENLREGGSGKKGKSSKKGGPSTYVENIDFLLGHNPILAILQCWQNSTKYPLTLASESFGLTYAAQSYTVSDANCVAIIGVTRTNGYSNVYFNDYGGTPAGPLSGSFQVPCWNEAILGPDPTNNAQWRNWSAVYRWQPSYGRTIYFDTQSFGSGATNFTVYFARRSGSNSPAAALRLSFENVLGSGSEYANYPSQQIQYPWYAGAGSPNLDLGSSGAIPALKTEVLGKYSVYPTGDADFVDMIQEVVKSGLGQAAVDGTLGVNPVQRGVNCYTYPGPIQLLHVRESYEFRVGSSFATSYRVPVTAGSMLVVVLGAQDAGLNTIVSVSDSLNGAWTQAVNYHGTFGNANRAVFYFAGSAAGVATVTLTFGGGGWAFEAVLLEIAGVDSFDGLASAQGVQPSVSLTTTNAAGDKSYVLAVSFRPAADPTAIAANQAQWPIIFDDWLYDSLGGGENGTFIQQTIVSNPQTLTQKWLTASSEATSALVLLGFKATVPPSYAAALPDILDATTLELTRSQCRAGGLWGSLTMDSQQAARDWLTMLCDGANCAPVWSGFKLKLIPRSEVSAIGNGAIYYAPTAAGPVANLSTENGDFIPREGESPITVVRTARVDIKTVLQMEHVSRGADYNQIVTEEPDPAGISLYGVRKADPVTNHAVHDVAIARSLLRINVRRQNYVANVLYKFTLNARWQLLEAMDLVTLTDPLQNILAVPVRLTKVDEAEDFTRACEAEPYVYGVHAPQAIAVTAPAPYSPNTAASAGNVNTPVIFEPVARLANNQSQLWFVVSSPSALYGGCQVYISTDGGNSYNLLGTCTGNATTGLTVGDWPAAADPDTTNDLAVNLTESLGALSSYQLADENNFTYPCYVSGGGVALTPYELMTYAVATLTSTYNYTLKATGGGNELRRAVFGAPGSAGVDHPNGSRFAFLLGEGVLKATMDPTWIGKTLYLKFLSFNTFGGASQSLSDVSPVTYTPVGTAAAANPNWQSYSLSPASPLSQPSATQISMAQVSAKFPANTVNYNARTFTIPDPGATPTTYYVTVADAGMTGDTGATTNLTATCQTSSALVGVAGNVYIGLLTAVHAGGGAAVGGGNPSPTGWLVNGG